MLRPCTFSPALGCYHPRAPFVQRTAHMVQLALPMQYTVNFRFAPPPPPRLCRCSVTVDMGGKMLVAPSHYTLRCGNKPALRNWELQASRHGVDWTCLRRHEDDHSLHDDLQTHSSGTQDSCTWPLPDAALETTTTTNAVEAAETAQDGDEGGGVAGEDGSGAAAAGVTGDLEGKAEYSESGCRGFGGTSGRMGGGGDGGDGGDGGGGKDRGDRGTRPYRFFRILSIGSQSGYNFVGLSGFELYGKVYRELDKPPRELSSVDKDLAY